MEKVDINFIVESNRFNFRVAAFIVADGKVLLQTNKECQFYNMPGGRVKMGESSLDALKRELKEELDISITDKQAVITMIAENMFSWLGKEMQELVFVYKVELDSSYEIVRKNNFSTGDSEDEINTWFEFNEVEHLVCRPELIHDLPIINKLTHVINKSK